MIPLKPRAFILPVIALAIVAIWTGQRHATLTTLRAENAELEKAIFTARQASAQSSATGTPDKANDGKSPATRQKIDWKKTASTFLDMNRSGGTADMRAMVRLQEQIQAMSLEELVAALDEIETLGLDPEARMMAEQIILGPLGEKDPALALNRFAPQLRSDKGSLSWRLADTFRKWINKDAAAAAAWLDARVNDGTFDSKSLDGENRSRTQFEATLAANLLGTDPTAAAARVAAYPAEMRTGLLRLIYLGVNKEEQLSPYAKIVREQAPPDERAKFIAAPLGSIMKPGSFKEVDGYLERIAATPEEKSACVAEAAKIRTLGSGKTLGKENIDGIRSWAATQVPGEVDKLTGQTIASAVEVNPRNTYADAAKLALEYRESTGNDTVLAEFLRHDLSRRNKETARELLGKIQDPVTREQLQEKLK